MDARQPKPHLFRAAAAAMVGFAMACGLLILFSNIAMPVSAAPLAIDVSGYIYTDTVWSGTVIVTDTVTVYSGTLTISPGTIVKFNSGEELVIQTGGRLIADGTSGQPITFTSNVTPVVSSCDWNTIRLFSDYNVIRHSTIEYAKWGIYAEPFSGGHDISYNIFRKNALCIPSPVGAAIAGSPDDTTIAENDFYDNASAIYVTKASGNTVFNNVISGTGLTAVAFVRSGSTPSVNNQVYSNTIRWSWAGGILLDLGYDNVISTNVIYNNRGDGVRLTDQNDAVVVQNRVYSSALNLSASPNAGIYINRGRDVVVRGNLVYANGPLGVGSYRAGLYVTGTQSVQITDNFIHDNIVDDGLEYGLNNSGTPVITGNAICRDPSFELRSQQVATLTAEGNWWGTNAPASEISGNVDYDPWIRLGLTPTNSSILADGVSTTTLNVTFNDGAGRTVPPPDRVISVTTSAGTLSANTVTVDDNGEASLTLTSAITPGSWVVTATDRCGYPVTATVEFQAAYNLAITKTAGVSWAVPGQTVTYTIEYTNTEPYIATGVIITDVLPISTTYAGSSLPPSGSSTGLVTWTLNTVGPNSGGSLVLSATIGSDVTCGQPITNTAYIDGDGDDPDVDNSDSAAIQIQCGVNLVVLKNDHVGTGDPRLVVPAGDVIAYTISVNNMGNQTANNVVLTETLPANTIFVGPTGANGWFQVGASNLYTYQVGTLYGIGGPGSNGTVVPFMVRVDPYLPCSITETVNTVETGSDQPELYPDDNISHEQTPVQCAFPGDMRVHKDDGVFCASPGQTITYTITYSNVGTSIINNVVLTDTRSQYANFLPGGLNAGWTPVGGRVYTRSVGAVGPGGPFGPVYFQVELLDSTTFPTDVTTITNVIQISGGHTDVEETWVPNVPDLATVKNDNIGVTTSEYTALYQRVVGKSPPINAQAVDVGPGDIIQYTILYVNNGRATATGVVLTDTLPLYTDYAGGPEWTLASGRLYTHTVGTLAPGQGWMLTFRVRVTDTLPAGLEWIVNRVEIGGDQLGDECNLGNNVSYEQTPVQPTGGEVTTNVYLPIILKNYPEGPPEPPPTQLAWVSDVAVDPATERVFVASPRQDAVHVIEGVSDTYNTSVAVGHGPTGLAVLTSTSPSKVFAVHAYAYNYWTPGVWIVDASTLASHSMADQGGYVGAAPVKVAANSVTDKVYVSNYYDRMPILHGPSEVLVDEVLKKSFQASYGIDVSQRSNLVYMATRDTGELVIFDGDWIEFNPDYGACHHAPPEARVLRMVAVNEATGHVFVTSPPDTNTGQTDSKVFVLDEDILLDETGGAPSDITCYWNLIQGEGDVGVAANPGTAWIKTLDLTGAFSAGEEGIAVNPVTGQVYVTDGPGDQLFVLQDSITKTNISLVTNVPVGDNPQGVDVNSDLGKVYVGNAGSNDVTVLSAVTPTLVITTIPLNP